MKMKKKPTKNHNGVELIVSESGLPAKLKTNHFKVPNSKWVYVISTFMGKLETIYR